MTLADARLQMQGYVGEILISLVLLIFGVSFRSWSGAIKESTKEILNKLEGLSKEFHQHRVQTENRITKVETKMESCEQKVDSK